MLCKGFIIINRAYSSLFLVYHPYKRPCFTPYFHADTYKETVFKDLFSPQLGLLNNSY